MKFCFYTNSVSPHQLPLARELIARLGKDDYRYVFTTTMTEGRKRCGWSNIEEPWIVQSKYGDGVVDEMLETCDVLMSGIRVLDLFEKRAVKGLKTLYVGERWFKPISIGVGQRCRCSVPGWLRMLVPSYRRMAKRFVRWINSDPNARCLTIGHWAKKDMVQIGVFEEKLVPWGYFVAPSAQQSNNRTIEQPVTPKQCECGSNNLKVLWVGRMLHWKRIDTIIRAVCEVEKRNWDVQQTIQLTLVGDGPEKPRLQRLASHALRRVGYSTVSLKPRSASVIFHHSQPIEQIREIMRSHDVYVLASNEQEGWGAALNEALEEGMHVIGTYEAGASATILGPGELYRTGDWRQLSAILRRCGCDKMDGRLHGQGIGQWDAKSAVKRLLAL